VKHAIVYLAALLVMQTPLATAAGADPYQIFAHARSVWMSQQYPPYVSYTIAVSVDENGVAKTNHYQAIYDSTRDAVHVDAVSAEERNDPHIPDGTNMTLEPKRNFRTIFKKRVGPTEQVVDFLGVPMLAPNYSFGIAPYVAPVQSQTADQAQLVAQIRQQFNDPMSEQKAEALSKAGGLKQIGSVTSTDREYDISYAGIDTLSGRSAYHLLLRPLRSADRHRLRELWVDTETFTTPQVVTQGNFANGGVPWTITFAVIGGVQYIASERAGAIVTVGPHRYDQATVSFQSVASTQPSRYLWDGIGTTKDTLSEPHF
jgi:hypothetical protein